MKTKSILMSILLAMGIIAAKAATGYPPELALVSQPVMVYNYNSITVYYDVENIGDYTYRGNVYLYLDPDYGYYYAKEYVRVSPGNIKRVSITIPARRIDRGIGFTIMPYYELDDELYSFTTFEYFEPISFYWSGPRTERWVVISAPPRIRFYTRPGIYRYCYDGFRPPMPPPGHAHGHGHGHGAPPPMNPKHHTYGYHRDNGGYPATHGTTPPADNNGGATVRPRPDGGSMSSGNSGNGNTPAPSTGSSSVRPDNGRTPSGNSGRTPSDNGSVSRPGSSSNSGTSRPGSNSGDSNIRRPRSDSGSGTNRPSSTSSSSGNGRSGNSGVSRPSSSSSSGTPSSGSRVGNDSSRSRSSGTSSGSSTRSSSGSSSSRSSSSSSSSSSSRSNSGATRR